MVAKRKPQPRKRPTNHREIILPAATFASLVSILCLCVFNFDFAANYGGDAKAEFQNKPRLEKCRSTCDDRLQSLALESAVPSSLSPTVIDSLFLQKDANVNLITNAKSPDAQSANEGDRQTPSMNDNRHNHYQSQSPEFRRPRRLPTLIKILTGFTDDTHWSLRYSSTDANEGQKPIIARIEKPWFVTRPSQSPSSRQRHPDDSKNNGYGESNDQLLTTKQETTVQRAAIAAATSLWAKSTRTFGNNRMNRINAEWDAALRWIAGWDSRVLSGGGLDLLVLGDAQQGSDGGHQGLSNGNTAKGRQREGESGQSNTQDGFHEFVDDLTKLLRSCVVQCLEDENFDFENKGQNKTSDYVAVGKSIAGSYILRSLCSWFVGSSLPRLSFGDTFDLFPKQSQFFVMGFVQLAISSVAAYALRSLWSWVSPSLFDCYFSQRYTETPEWLIEHEKEIELAKNGHRKRKKMGSSKKGKKKNNTNKPAAGNNPKQETIGNNRDTAKSSRSEEDYWSTRRTGMPLSNRKQMHTDGHDMPSWRMSDSSELDNDAEWRDAKPLKKTHSSVENISVVANDSAAGDRIPRDHEEAPSTSSLSSSSTTVSTPSFKPIRSHAQEQNIPQPSLPHEVSQPYTISERAPPSIHSIKSPLILSQNQKIALPVPTQEQRIEAAKKLRDFQNAQIQLILYRKKLVEALKNNPLDSADSNGTKSLLGSFLLPTGSDNMMGGNGSFTRAPLLKPPPGLVHPSEIQPSNHHHYDDDSSFLNGNDFLSKLLDDDEDDDDEYDLLATSLRNEIVSMSNEMSLDPSAAPFVSDNVTTSSNGACTQSGTDHLPDSWKTPASTSVDGSNRYPIGSFKTSLHDNGRSNIKGVYGGSVW